ncbi:MAG: hypothetical protein KC708_24715, partial [Anaerolineae bacterium]|nr:hypothetical protein [Anaerolineae bacterium]
MSQVENTADDQTLGEQLANEPEVAREREKSWLNRTFWQRIPEKYRQNVQPEILGVNLLPGEEVQIEIRLAWYRDILSRLIFGRLTWILLLVVVSSAILFFVTGNAYTVLIPLGLLLLGMAEASREFIEYQQWRMIKTNKRLIISLPQPGSWPLVDNIE